MLAAAFDSADGRAFNAYGQFPRAVLACTAAQAAFQATFGSPPVRGVSAHGRPLFDAAFEDWLKSLAHAATKGRRGERAEAQRQVSDLRGASEKQLLGALEAYGASRKSIELPRTLSMKEIAERTGLSRTAVAERLKTLGVRRFCRRDGHRVLVRDLLTKWPECVRVHPGA